VKIPPGYKLLIATDQGTVVGSIDLEGYDLDKIPAGMSLIMDIQETVENDMKKKEEPR